MNSNPKSSLIMYILNLIQYIKNAFLFYGSMRDFREITFKKIGIFNNSCVELFENPLINIDNNFLIIHITKNDVIKLFDFFEKIDFNRIVYHVKNCNRKNKKKEMSFRVMKYIKKIMMVLNGIPRLKQLQINI